MSNFYLISILLSVFQIFQNVQLLPEKCHHDLGIEKMDDNNWISNFPKFLNGSGYDITKDSVDKPESKLPSNLLTPPEPTKSFPSWVSVPIESLHLTLFKRVFKLLISKGIFYNCRHEREQNPYIFRAPKAIRNLFDFSIGQPVNHDTLIKLLETIIIYSPHNAHPFVLTRRTAGLDPYGIIADWIASVTSGISGSYILAPGFSIMEIEICRKIREYVGYPNKDMPFGGVFVPGAGTAIQFALQVALQKKIPGIKEKGVFGVGNGTLKPCFFMSDAASYSAEKGALFQGIGLQAVWKVKIDDKGRMIMSELRKRILEAKSKGWTPFLAYATAGTPRLGAIDPINEMAAICKEYGLWLHVDANIGGGVILTKSQKYRLAGVEKSDSFSWSITQSFALPFTTTILVTKEQVLETTIGLGDMPVFGHPPFYNGSYDSGDTSLQTARRADVLKFWFIWKAKGRKGLSGHINYNFANIDYALKLIQNKTKIYRVLLPKFDLCLFSFVMIHPSVAQFDWKSEKFKKVNDVFTNTLKARLLIDGVMRISVSSLGDYPKFFTIFFNNNALSMEDIQYIFAQLENYASQITFTPDGKVKVGSISKSKVKLPAPPTKFHQFVSASIPQKHISFFVQVIKVFLEKAIFAENRRKQPVEFLEPEKFEKIFDVKLNDDPLSNDKLLGVVKDIIKYNSFQAAPYYMYQLVSGRDAYSMIGDFFIAAMNPPMITYEDHPIFITMENEILKEIRKIIGYPDTGDGIPTAGSGFAVQISIALARHKKFPDAKQFGNNFPNKSMIIYMSKRTKRAYMKGAFYAGLGLFKAVEIDTTFNGRMEPAHLKKEIQKTIANGEIPLMVATSVGTSIFGAIDPLDEIAAVCKEFQVWMHVDGSYDGAIIMSKNQLYRVKGIEKSDSFHLNAHRLLGVVAFSTAFVTRHNGLMISAFGLASSVDFSNDSALYEKGENDLGDKNIETVRRADLFKFWLMWKAKGTVGLGAHIDRVFELTAFLASELVKHPRYEPFQEKWDTTNVCFLYVPDRLKSLFKTGKNTTEYAHKLSEVTHALQAKLARSGVTFSQVTSVGPSTPHFFRWAITHSSLSEADISHLIKQTDEFGKSL